MESLLKSITSLDLSSPKTVLGYYFMDVLGVLSILFGGVLLLFAWKHHDYFLGLIGFLAGAFGGLLFKAHLFASEGIAHLLYIAVCGTALAVLSVFFKRLVGIALGGILVALALVLLRPTVLQGGGQGTVTLALAYLLGGGLGALFPREVYILTTSLFGAAFATFGLTITLVPVLAPRLPLGSDPLVHALIFVPLFVFGMAYQFISTRRDPPPALRPTGP